MMYIILLCAVFVTTIAFVVYLQYVKKDKGPRLSAPPVRRQSSSLQLSPVKNSFPGKLDGGRSKQALKALAGSADAAKIAEGKKLLIVDDQPLIRLMLAELFQKAGFTVYEAADGLNALEQFERHGADCILLDFMLPDMDGLDVLCAIRKSDANVKVLLITAYGEPEKMEAAAELGVTEWIEKPFDTDQLLNRVLALV
ncbi:Response regulator receiver domain-containing protein [Paenibacillus algorifonticola]|uniref:Response regulator receiver domain-containing protein n=1 Tax=Paenibacillus algorifonticola TaxID=684063 RepID=A0A1I2BS20_9BACL|nr:response regulator [Paenibacillus algorifonticola]SFE58113.1 Response regulator receiver domain-containing protein [Paenibacillus algorifonticola]